MAEEKKKIFSGTEINTENHTIFLVVVQNTECW